MKIYNTEFIVIVRNLLKYVTKRCEQDLRTLKSLCTFVNKCQAKYGTKKENEITCSIRIKCINMNVVSVWDKRDKMNDNVLSIELQIAFKYK